MAEVIQGHDDQSRYQRQLPDKVMHPDPVTLETAERPNDIKKQDWAFVARLRAAILNGLESAASVLRHLWLFIFLVAVGLVWLAWFASGVEILVGDIRELGLMHSCRYVHAIGTHQETLFYEAGDASGSFDRPCPRTIRSPRTSVAVHGHLSRLKWGSEREPSRLRERQENGRELLNEPIPAKLTQLLRQVELQGQD